jgi:hypothetical protein
MYLSIYLAKSFGLYLFIVGLAMTLKKKRFEQVIDELVASPAGLFIVATMTLILGVLLIVAHNIWVADWRVIITSLAWLTFIAGLVRTFIPEFIEKMAPRIHKDAVYYPIAIVSLLLGSYLLYVGFWLF